LGVAAGQSLAVAQMVKPPPLVHWVMGWQESDCARRKKQQYCEAGHADELAQAADRPPLQAAGSLAGTHDSDVCPLLVWRAQHAWLPVRQVVVPQGMLVEPVWPPPPRPPVPLDPPVPAPVVPASPAIGISPSSRLVRPHPAPRAAATRMGAMKMKTEGKQVAARMTLVDMISALSQKIKAGAAAKQDRRPKVRSGNL
jgi:hypothetical protein